MHNRRGFVQLCAIGTPKDKFQAPSIQDGRREVLGRPQVAQKGPGKIRIKIMIMSRRLGPLPEKVTKLHLAVLGVFARKNA